MKKFISTILCFSLYCSLFAQATIETGEPEAVASQSVTFFDIIMNSGFIGVIVWFFIFTLTGTGFLLGIWAIISSATVKSKQVPLSIKLLVTGIFLLFFFGLFGAVIGTVDSFAGLATATGPAKDQILALSISQVLYSLAFSLLGCIEYMFFLIMSIIILHYKHKKIINKNL